MPPLLIDGSSGEGGGQILRTSLALSAVTGRPFRIERIRARRPKPGLQRQHLAAVQAAAAVCGAEVRGATLGSTALDFVPGRPVPGGYRFDVGSAGSTGLVLQTVLPALLTAPGPSRLVLEGGTHNPAAPPFDFLARVFVPLVSRMGPRIEATLERHGFFPAGGGRVTVRIEPAGRLARLDLLERGAVVARRGRVLSANLPGSIAEREVAVLRRRLGWRGAEFLIEEVRDSPGPGNAVMVELQSERATEVVTAFGQPGVRAEAVAEAAAAGTLRYLDAGVPVGEHLADQLLVPMALAGAGSFRTLPLSPHATTNIETIRRLLEVPIPTRAESAGGTVVEIGGPAEAVRSSGVRRIRDEILAAADTTGIPLSELAPAERDALWVDLWRGFAGGEPRGSPLREAVLDAQKARDPDARWRLPEAIRDRPAVLLFEPADEAAAFRFARGADLPAVLGPRRDLDYYLTDPAATLLVCYADDALIAARPTSSAPRST
jgi:RNA 3'-terminal phosphate cyclase (ATP)